MVQSLTLNLGALMQKKKKKEQKVGKVFVCCYSVCKSCVVSKVHSFFFSFSAQGEDGFPGFKGDMGLKGDRVSTHIKNNNKYNNPYILNIKYEIYVLDFVL